MDDWKLLEENLRGKGYTVETFPDRCAAAEWIENQIGGRTVGIGGSVTVRELGLFEKLSKHNTVYWHEEPPENMTAMETRQAASRADIPSGGDREYGLYRESGVRHLLWPPGGLSHHWAEQVGTGPARCAGQGKKCRIPAERKAAEQENAMCSPGRPVLSLQKPGKNLSKSVYPAGTASGRGIPYYSD